MATVSILIPANNAQYLARALISAQQQTFADIEILVGDNTPGGNLEAIVRRVGDSRVQYFLHGFKSDSDNARQLWARAAGKYVKWLFGDDVLMPTSVEALAAALRDHPESSLAFHDRVIIDENDQVTQVPPALIKDGERVLLDRAFLAEQMVAHQHNFIGEPSNIMLNRERTDFAGAFNYRAFELHFLANVAMYLNLAESAPVIAVGGYLSAFRQHAWQKPALVGAGVGAGLIEWEMMVRGEAAAGHLSTDSLDAAKQRLATLYANWADSFPGFATRPGNLDELTQLPAHELFDSPRFQADLAHARATALRAKETTPAFVA
ncbi:glycosyltransferase family 2 protein [Paraburkholderia sartisoli]|uniref:Glycosyl transferase family 2 n=1 Tax=Paraburkholderia sartisoli TaxID=83784 RepID=A0A1H4G1R0_9BURK|nr:glycosyltransferase [Paraburkholderia sartisoli]SEB03337.1 Glycosyl transferase family 2 [Paraburkholderia sartisoli]